MVKLNCIGFYRKHLFFAINTYNKTDRRFIEKSEIFMCTSCCTNEWVLPLKCITFFIIPIVISSTPLFMDSSK